MNCAWQAYLNLLPLWMRESIDEYGKEHLLELRMRQGEPPELVLLNGRKSLTKAVTKQDILFSINIASQYSPWASKTIEKGFITSQGGHRVGICGSVSNKEGKCATISGPTSLCIRVARNIPNISDKINITNQSVIIIGAPGCGKTTLLRDYTRNISNQGQTVCVIDQREEIFPKHENTFCFPIGLHTDVLSGCSKEDGIEMALRNMTPDIIAVDEITSMEDCCAIENAAWCGVKLIATAHAGSVEEFRQRPVYRTLIHNRIFQIVVILRKDKSYVVERI